MSAVQVFDSILKELPTLKAPGVSGTRIKKLTDMAVANVKDESQLITALYSSCKAAPSSHKLGTLYVVDSIVRIYMDEAKKRGEEVSASAPEGTFAAGVYRIGELVESLIDDAMELLILQASATKILKLVDIWERALTFKPEKIAAIRKKHFDSLTPQGSPPGKKQELASTAPALSESNAAMPSSSASSSSALPSTLPAAPTTVSTEQNKAALDSGGILLALASLTKKASTPTPPQSGTPVVANAAPSANNNTTNILSQLSALAGTGTGNGSTPPVGHAPIQSPSVAQAQPQPGNKEFIFNMLQQIQGNGAQNPGQAPYPGAGAGAGAAAPLPQHGMPPVPQTQGMPPIPHMPPQHGQQNGYQSYQNDRRGRDELGGYLRRNRSRSPPNRYNRYENNRYENNGYDNNSYENNRSQQQQQRNSGAQQFGAEGEQNVEGNPNFRPRNMGFDSTLPQGSFKVLSRTLFIGGVPRGMDERELASHLRPYAVVQSVILNSERKHAFVKVYSRKEAEQVIQSFNKDGALPLRTRWGVGFGPRDCCNYQHGISIIPIERLTEADRTWVVSAQWGGTGGIPLESGMVMDEPDIEIGTGISSKAMSKKMPTNSTRNGPKSNRPGESGDQYAKAHLGGGPQDFRGGYAQGPNPLSGLFANQAPQAGGFPPQMPPQMASPMGQMHPQMSQPMGQPMGQQMPPQMPPQMQSQGYPPQTNYGGPNYGGGMPNFYQNGQ